MSSFKQLFRPKKHAYAQVSQLQSMTPEQIVRLDPSLVSSRLEEDKAAVASTLSRPQRQALTRLLAIKRQMKSIPHLNREAAILDFLDREGLHDDRRKASAVDELMVQTQREMMQDQLATKDLQNRVHQLRDAPTVPDTEEEAIYRRLQALRTGGSNCNSSRRRRGQPRRRQLTQRLHQSVKQPRRRRGRGRRTRGRRGRGKGSSTHRR